jgi:hypothetical protein
MNRRPLILAAVALALGAYLAVEHADWLLPSGGDDTVSRMSSQDSGKAAEGGKSAKLNPLEGMQAATYASIVEQPLFNPGRRPPAPEPEPQAEPPAPEIAPEAPPPAAPEGPNAADYLLIGVSDGPSGRVAAVKIAQTTEVFYVREGQTVGPWTVLSVGDRDVTIGNADNPVTLRLFENLGTRAPLGEDPAPEEPAPPDEPPEPPPPPPPVLEMQPPGGDG